MTTNVNLGFVADAAGTVDAITATYTPTYTVLIDKMLVWFRATGANTSATPTFSPNGLTAHTIVKQGGQPLVAGDIPRAGAIMEMVYDATNTRWELVNPAVASNISGWTDDGADVRLTTIGDSVGIGTATPAAKLHIVGGVQVDAAVSAFVSNIGDVGAGNYTEHHLGNSSFTVTNRVAGVDESGISFSPADLGGDQKFVIRPVVDDTDLYLFAGNFAASAGRVVLATHDTGTGTNEEAGAFDGNTTANQTRFLIYDTQTATLKRVKVGANGTGPGGTGRALYIDNE